MPSDRLLGADQASAPTRGRNPRSARLRLIDAAMEAIDAHGEGAVRVQDIVEAAGVPIPILYRHFGNREGLLQAAQIERLAGELDAELVEIRAAFAAVDSAESFRALIDRLLRVINSPERRTQRWRRANIIGSTYGRPALAEAVNEVQSRFVDGVADALRGVQQNGWIRAELDVSTFAAWFIGQTLGRVIIELGETSTFDEVWNEISSLAVRAVLFGAD